MKKINVEFSKILSIVVIAIIFAFAVVCLEYNDKEYIVAVTDKERVVKYNEGISKYLVFADSDDGDSLVFENTDTIFRLKFNSSNVQSKLKVGNKYKITVVGVRIPFLSTYENIIKVDEIEE